MAGYFTPDGRYISEADQQITNTDPNRNNYRVSSTPVTNDLRTYAGDGKFASGMFGGSAGAASPIQQQTGTGLLGGYDTLLQHQQQFWNGDNIGQTVDFAGGKLKRVSADRADYYTPDGRRIIINPQTDPGILAGSSPGVAQLWARDYGYTVPQRTGAPTSDGTFSVGGSAAGNTSSNPGGGAGSAPGGMFYPGGSSNFDETTGTYRNAGNSGGAFGGMFQDVNVNSYSQNPYLAQMGTVLTNRITDNLNRNIMPGIRSNAIAAGGFGGSRQGVVEANALNDANRSISDALTGVNFQDFTNQMNRNLQQYGQNQNFYTNQRGQDLSQTALGANLFQQGNQGFLSQGQGIYGLGTTQQQAPWQTVNNANAGLGQWSGFGSTTSANTGGGAQGVLGGALAGGQFGNLWGSPSASNNWSGIPYNANTTIPMQPGGGY